jgi:hypothetical protein
MKLLKNLVLLLLCSATTATWAQQIVLPLGGNAYSSKKTENRRSGAITDEGITRWTDPQEVFTAYFRATNKGTLKIDLNDFKVVGTAEIEFSINNKKIPIKLSEGMTAASVGMWDITDTGYIAIKIKGISKSAAQFPSISSLNLWGEPATGNVVYVKSKEDGLFHFGRRGPSTHLNYEFPKNTDVEWFYNEVTIPIGEDKIGSYFMANGFAHGYFGIQVNSETERRVLFSVWSPFTTDNPKEIPEDHKIKLIKKGENVKGGEFGGEGSGGQSYMQYQWKAGNTYKFLLHAKPVANNYTEYSAYFFAPELKQWQLIASFQRPQTQTYIKQPYSFLENFSPNMGDVTRTGTYGNQWVCDTKGNWTEVDKAYFTYDATARKGYRKDYQGGIHQNGNFYLKIDGFFNDFTTYRTLLTRRKTGEQPKINFSKLP